MSDHDLSSDFVSSDIGFTPVNWSCTTTQSIPTFTNLSRLQNFEDEDQDPSSSISRVRRSFLVEHLGLGDDRLGPALAKLCPNTPTKPKRGTTATTQYRGKGRPRKTDVVNEETTRPRKAKRTKILLEHLDGEEDGQTSVSNIFRATKFRLDDDTDPLPDDHEHERPPKSGQELGNTTQFWPNFYYGSDPPLAPRDTANQDDVNRYDLGLDETLIPETPERREDDQDLYDRDSLFDAFVNADPSELALQPSHQAQFEQLEHAAPMILTAENQLLKKFPAVASTREYVLVETHDEDLFESLPDAAFDDEVVFFDTEEHCSSTPCQLAARQTRSSQVDSFQAQPGRQHQTCLETQQNMQYEIDEDDWNDIDDIALSDAASVVDLAEDGSSKEQTHKHEDNFEGFASESKPSYIPTGSPGFTRSAIVRPPFPAQTRDRSLILGLSNDTLLRTCFRIGEALNVGCNAVRGGRDIILELYARVVASHREEAATSGTPSMASTPNAREGAKQHFTFADLFHNHGPFITGVYEGWKGVDLFDADSASFLSTHWQPGGRMCRVLGRMRRVSKVQCGLNGNVYKRIWELDVVSIWEARWDDVEWVEGIICA